MTVKEAARLLRVHPSTLDRERLAGRMPCVRIGRRVLFTPEQLNDYINKRKTGRCDQDHGSLNTKGVGSSSGATLATSTFTGADPAHAASAARAHSQAILKSRRSGSFPSPTSEENSNKLRPTRSAFTKL
ncbi:MAG: helix-turn-helix domain-containing protein [Phycisphaerales bacterium]|nr:helix-turn-helix domain-containing protein [Phycisphaerales bacterium]